MNTVTTPAVSTRYDFLDWLRVIAIFVLLFYHTGMLFVGWSWHVQNAEVLTALQFPMGIAHRLRMPLLFVIAGAGMWFALGNRHGGGLVRERSLRLLLPLVAGMLLIVPPQIYFERLFRGQWDGGYLSFFFERVLQFQPYPKGDFSWHHLWFVAYLYVYVFLLLPLLLWWRSAKKAVKPGVWLYALAIPLAVNEAILKPLYPESHKLIGDWYIFNHYLLLTLYGCLLASMRDAWDWFATRRQLSLGLALIVFGTAMLLFETGVIERDTPADALVANVFTWTSLMAFIGYGRRYLSFCNPAAALGARRELSDLHPAPDRDRRARLLGDSAALERVDEVPDRAARDDGDLRRAVRRDPTVRPDAAAVRDEGRRQGSQGREPARARRRPSDCDGR